jgi:hypothetical protein
MLTGAVEVPQTPETAAVRQPPASSLGLGAVGLADGAYLRAPSATLASRADALGAPASTSSGSLLAESGLRHTSRVVGAKRTFAAADLIAPATHGETPAHWPARLLAYAVSRNPAFIKPEKHDSYRNGVACDNIPYSCSARQQARLLLEEAGPHAFATLPLSAHNITVSHPARC